jgi:hypothetical protein
MSGNLYFGGVPTAPEVELLMTKLDAKPGASFTLDQIVEIINIDATQNRFASVTAAWRKKLFRERALQSKREGGVIKFLTANAAHDEAISGITRIARAARHTRIKADAVNVDDLSNERREAHALVRRELMAVHEAGEKARKGVALPKPSAGSTLRLASTKA